ncbi:hypothetical protein NA56DRAFT_709622 [Hyaloscypha hepaticicola]|uniref:Carboxylesterase type B domain-containing protein n=1 Tax=Hyaloscypha hepaticicola TaxID=2082293 RepID=A0A2J6PNY2_9HELO|nr:hypothetical protein NA56DRAFT_709622 [Hyaloscypha hepaticicola]
MHHITAYGGKTTVGSTPFHAALTQSAAFYPYTSQSDLDTTFNAYLTEAGWFTSPFLYISSAEIASELFNRSFLNGIRQVLPSCHKHLPARFDGVLLSTIFMFLILLVFHCQKETTTSRSKLLLNRTQMKEPSSTLNDLFNKHVKTLLPHASSSVLKYVNETLYPAIYEGSHNYTNPFDRGSLFISEFIIACNARYLVKAFSSANEYLFSVPPGYHGMDVPYKYFTSSNDIVSNNTLAEILQRYITNFAKTGSPNGTVLCPPNACPCP